MTVIPLEQLLDLERAGWSSLCDGSGAAFYGDLMTEDGLMVLVNGAVLDRAGVQESLNDAPPWDGFEILEPRVVGLGDDAAVLVYRADAVRRGAEPFRALMSSTYRLVDGRLRLAMYQQTTAAP